MKARIATGLAALAFAGQAFAMTYFLQNQWYEGGNHFCKYSNGTVLNIGVGVCAMSIDS